MENNDVERLTLHLNRIIDNLNQHWHSITLLLGHVSKPLTVDDRGLAHTLHDFRKYMIEFLEEIKTIDLGQTFSEIKYIGNRLNEIEKTLKEIKGTGITKNIQLDFTVDGYQMVKKPMGYDPQDQIEKPNESLKELLNTLTDRERKVVTHRLGLFGEKKKTYEKIGEIFGLTRERISVIFAKAIRKCRHPERKELMQKITHSGLRKEVFGE
jgi:RNA polymerase sigma factor (sigma-70 family)